MPRYTLIVNGQTRTVSAPANMAMLWVLRDKLGITGPKYGCGIGACRACTSHLDGVAFNPCITTVSECAVVLGGPEHRVTTIEGLAPNDVELHPVQEAWLNLDVAACGYCQAGQIMAAAAFLAEFPNPTDAQIDEKIENVCRCGTYVRIRAAIKEAAAAL